MATIPDIPTLQQALIEVFVYFHHGRPRPDDGLPWSSIRSKWEPIGFRAEDFNRLVEYMLKEGTLTIKNHVYSLTYKSVELGLITLTTIKEIEDAILGQFAKHNSRVGETLQQYAIQTVLFDEGFTGQNCVDGFQSLIRKGDLETIDNQMLRITQKGFEAM